MGDAHVDQEFLAEIIRAIVNNPDEVKVTRTVDERGVLLTLDVNPTDIGYVVGRRGRTIQAIRTLVKVVGAKNQALVNLKLNEPEGGRRPRMDEGGMAMGAGAGMGGGAPSSAPSVNMDDVDTSAIDNIDI